MTVVIHRGTRVPHDGHPGRDKWTFEASLDGQAGIVELSCSAGTGYEQASGYAQEILEQHPERFQGVTSTERGVHDVWRVQTPDGS